jgi:ParB-like chromosome segregation protein Spo0J
LASLSSRMDVVYSKMWKRLRKQRLQRAPPPRPTRLIDELRTLKEEIIAHLRRVPKIPRHVWAFLGVEDPLQEQELLNSTDRLTEALDSAIAMLEADLAIKLDRKGGRRSDPRMQQFAMALAQIFQTYTEERPTITFDRETGHMVSRFERFAFEAFTQFYPHQPFPEGALQLALRHAVSFERDRGYVGS